MPKLSPNAVPSYRLHKQSGQGIVTLDGRDILLGAHGTAGSRDRYNRLVAEWVAGGRQLPQRKDISVAGVIVAFWKHAQTHYRTVDGRLSGELENFRFVLRPLKRLYGETPAVEFGPLRLKALRDDMTRPHEETNARTGKTVTRPGWCRTHVNRQVNRIRHVFRWATENELIPSSISHALDTVAPLMKGRTEARETAPIKPVEKKHVAAVLAHLSPQVRALVELQALTGARGSELFPLRTCDLDTSQTAAEVRDRCNECRLLGKACQHHTHWLYRPTAHKTAYLGHLREIRFGPQAQAILGPFLKPDIQACLFSPADAEMARHAARYAVRKTPPSCGNAPGSNRRSNPQKQPGDRYTKDSYALAIGMACRIAFPPPVELKRVKVKGRKKENQRWETSQEWAARLGPAKWAELKAWRKAHHWHPHQLRHAVATRVRRDYGIEAAQVVLGQKTITTTQLYAEKNAAVADAVMAEVG